ncbi:hypothetical protein FisN_2HuN12 [Fistulifera solaris]|uniref:Uncharacterized protein n=1 Tax=Fistulifera solaris TaxID=1519565 RepID=A0A1Z5JGB1_FISSO|nr:hypothetical protein FisN_2HuN12 [Fistulifera solaris]|eukprot:GAX13034.1 hypothetical protein FisN_2HuN12 [Fistulifera solaris]
MTRDNFPEFQESQLLFVMIPNPKQRFQNIWNVHSVLVGSKELVQNFWITIEFQYDQKYLFPDFLESQLLFVMIPNPKQRVQNIWNVHSVLVGSKELVQNFWITIEFLYDQKYRLKKFWNVHSAQPFGGI